MKVRQKIKKGQIWKKKRNGILFRIDGGGGQDWYGERTGMGENQRKPRTHHITAFTLFKEWELCQFSTSGVDTGGSIRT